MVTRIIAKKVANKAPRRATAKVVRKNGADADQGTPGPTGERMSKVDTAWLRMDSPMNLMMIVGVWIIKPGVSYRAVCERVEERLLKYPRFGQRVEQDALGAIWVRDEDFRIERHVVVEKLRPSAKGGEQQALQDRLGELAVQPLDMNHPLWQFHLVEHYQGGSALMARIHHCIADGIALIAVTQSLMDGGSEPPQRTARASNHEGEAGAEDWIADMLIKPFTDAAVKALGAAGDGAVNAMEMMIEPKKGLEKGMELGLAGSVELAKLAYHVVRDGAALALMADDSPTRLKGIPGTAKRVAWCQPVPLDEVKAVAKALNCSINDVLLSCVAGAIGEYLRSFGDEIAGKEIRAMVPVNLRPIEDAYKLGNRFGLAPVVLPIGIENPVERVYEVRRRMGEMKGSMQPLLAYGLLAVAGLLIKPAQDAMLSLFSRKTTAVMTNVPGPREKLKFCGATLEQNLVWVPQSGTVGLGVSILSYGGGVQFGVISDAKLCPDPQKIINEFEPEFSKLAMVTLMLPWGE
ncbi:wax ester/triacylglycerol synthase family O-acyltransferase [Rhodoferax sp.]|uniref:wax ester/triacylglycerol synthase family O-acyltransferase n=1 Tax=Rhodoferax sp. TaxID=50421 RepID=UPI00271F992C|nr:wax ester/triacylglycerol synthase family O-acyltransferase [Rhodoferax sp.]MDO9197015.1 wax ester/triacylglycerol synthase family O-acyltransferase [Rhodoferax sp.]